jgi:amino acid efflux transporter
VFCRSGSVRASGIEFKQPNAISRALMIGLLLAGTVYWACTVLVLHFNAFGAIKPPRHRCRASLNCSASSPVGGLRHWLSGLFCQPQYLYSELCPSGVVAALYKPESRLARLSKRQLPLNALNAVLGCCVLSTLGIYWLNINLDALIVYANGIFIMIYLLCMLAGCRLLKGRIKPGLIGGVLCLLLLAMVGWKSLYAIVMLAGWLFLPKRSSILYARWR